MAVLSKEQLMEQIKKRIPQDNISDDDISFLEDVSETISDYESRTGEDWKAKYEENDKMWRKKYVERFTTIEKMEDEDEETEIEVEEKRTYEDLFN